MWKIQYTQKAVKSLKKLNPNVLENLRVAIEELKSKPDLGKQLTGPLKGLRSLRVAYYLQKRDPRTCCFSNSSWTQERSI